MRLVITITFLFATTFLFAQPDDPWKGKPKDLLDAHSFLYKMFDDTALYSFMSFPEDISTSRLHSGFGMWMRNNWGLWGNSQLKRSLEDSGFVHADDMSAIILKSFHRRLNDKPLNVRKDAEEYMKYWKKSGDGFSAPDLGSDHKQQTTREELMNYFSVGDTVRLAVYATEKRLFQTYGGGLGAIGVVLGKNDDEGKMKLLLTHVERRKRMKSESVKGDTLETAAYYCTPIPPRNWRRPLLSKQLRYK